MHELSPRQKPLQDVADRLHEKYRALDEGAVATDIPELAKADPGGFGISLAAADGAVCTAGDWQKEFTIQSISKALVYGLALEQRGRDEVLRHVGVEPSGEAFNGLALNRQNRPFNPMVNAGAICTTALVRAKPGGTRFDCILDTLSRAAGRRLAVDEAVYQSEKATGHRNRALGHLLLNFGKIEGDVEEHLDLYFRQCSLLVNARDLAVMGATLANLGENPVTREQVYQLPAVRDALSAMFTCGMYDFAGEWAHRVGVPAKSGVGGGIMAVVNRQLGVSVYSPRLDEHGNSVRGIRVCIELAEEFGLHAFDYGNFGSSFLTSLG
jgi:glutaminase